MKVSKLLWGAAALAMCGVPFVAAQGSASGAASSAPKLRFTCANSRLLCTEVRNSDDVFGHYVGHDEPSLLFYSHQAGSGNQMRYSGIVPTDPPPTNPAGKSYNFELAPAFWFGMAMCDTQSFPLTVKTCKADSDSNIVPASNPNHAGTAFTELQFYPPGWVQQFNGPSCSARQWCVALNIDSLSISNVTGQPINTTCQAQGLVSQEPVNFAYLTHSGKPQGPPDPVHFDFVKSGLPDPAKVLMLNAGDHFTVVMHDSAHGLYTEVDDLTTGQKGFMTASASNGFAQVKYAPKPSKECTALPYDFHPMYSTSSTQTNVPWAIHTYNIAFDDEIGHFQSCTNVPTPGGSCKGTGPNGQAQDFDDNVCFGPQFSTLVKVGGCLDANEGFDGSSYQPVWPNGDTQNRPGPLVFTSPRTGSNYSSPYQQVAFESDVPPLEIKDNSPQNNCDVRTGAGCTRVPIADYHGPVQFYPYFSSGPALGGCAWTIGQDVPGFTTNNYGKVGQYGGLIDTPFNTGGHTVGHGFYDFRQVLGGNPCA